MTDHKARSSRAAPIARALSSGVAAAAIVHVLVAVVPDALDALGMLVATGTSWDVRALYLGIQGLPLIVSCLVDALPAGGTRGLHLCEGATTVRLLSRSSIGTQPLGYMLGLPAFAAAQSIAAFVVAISRPPGVRKARWEIVLGCCFAAMYLAAGTALSFLALILYTSS